MLELGLGRDSDGDQLSLETANSSQSSMSSESCSSFSRHSFDAAAAAAATVAPIELSTSQSQEENTNRSISLKPHRSSDFAYSAIRSATFGRESGLTFHDFNILKKIGAGDIGTVYLCRLSNHNNNDEVNSNLSCYYAMKVVDKEILAVKKKVHRAEMEKKILKMLDHPFLPTLYAEFEASHFSCIVMEYCSGGDLHSLRHKQPHKRFSLNSARFYAAEVLVALEYLHMLGIIYRDLKPENVLVRSDGHIMLSDFDLSLCSDAIPAVESPDSSPPYVPSPSTTPSYSRSHTSTTSTSSSLSPFACFPNRLFRSRRVQTLTAANRLFVAEPVTARSCSFVGTHEYVSPEVASGRSHGNAVDWWAYGVFIYEMIYGRTPFAAQSNELTLLNIVKTPLAFPTPMPSSPLELHARDLISGLLDKDPTRRLGAKRGAAEVKKHPFFKGLNLALIRSSPPPELVPGLRRQKTTPFDCNSNNNSNINRNSNGICSKHSSTAFDYF
ncbi:protein kinase PINOID [Cannabis sativa]|uniref:protein kinase PINOID n=1 Tax=Cannabis sativa TaxID=3483 RepID=UPI0011DFE2FA|nr:protein kinase PINOID [Cannabis sativa]